MNHLSGAELVAFIEAAPELPVERVRHAESCDACRAEADALRSVLLVATDNEVPPPSPLYWDHLSSRIADAIRSEPAPRLVIRDTWWRWPASPWGAATTAAALVVLTMALRTTMYAPVPVVRPPVAERIEMAAPVGSGAEIPEPMLDADNDAAWAIVRAAADDLGWEDAHAAGLAARPGSAEGIALELSAEERVELGRLLGLELKRNGV